MKTITLKINTDTKKGAALMLFLEQFLKNEKSVEIMEDKSRYNPETEKVIADAKKGIGVNRAKNSKELFKALGI